MTSCCFLIDVSCPEIPLHSGEGRPTPDPLCGVFFLSPLCVHPTAPLWSSAAPALSPEGGGTALSQEQDEWRLGRLGHVACFPRPSRGNRNSTSRVVVKVN